MSLSVETKRKLCILGIAVGVYLGFRYLVPAAVPFFIGWMLAVWIYPVGEWVEKKTGLKKTWAGTALLLLMLAGFLWLLWVCKDLLWQQIRLAVSNFSNMSDWAMETLDQCCQAAEQITGIQKETSKGFLLTQAGQIQENLAKSVTPGNLFRLLSQAGKVVAVGTGIVISWLSGVLFLQEMESIRRKVQEFSVLKGVRRICRRLGTTTAAYLKAQLVIMAIVGAICTLGFWFLGSPYYLLFGIGLGLLDALPVIGTGTFLYPAALYFLLQKEFTLAAGCVVLDLVTSVVREFLEPKLIGGKLGVSPVVILAAVYFGFYLYGPWGFLAGPLSLSVAYEIGKEWDIWD